jgi:hypothetical protein
MIRWKLCHREIKIHGLSGGNYVPSSKRVVHFCAWFDELSNVLWLAVLQWVLMGEFGFDIT